MTGRKPPFSGKGQGYLGSQLRMTAMGAGLILLLVGLYELADWLGLV
ncbi:hypothetical protein [Xanthomonas sp. XNM01]|nr:hypothetical protein [Xanthomonas sp. XNM01]MBD9369541.1 hypothetical protein [Xanthomonas sp. XNM01]